MFALKSILFYSYTLDILQFFCYSDSGRR